MVELKKESDTGPKKPNNNKVMPLSGRNKTNISKDKQTNQYDIMSNNLLTNNDVTIQNDTSYPENRLFTEYSNAKEDDLIINQGDRHVCEDSKIVSLIS